MKPTPNISNLLALSIGANLRKIRLRENLTQQELANMANVGRTSVTNIESGKQLPPVDLLYVIGAALGVRIEELLPNSMGQDLSISGPPCRKDYLWRQRVSSTALHCTLCKKAFERLRMTPTPEQIKALYFAANDLLCEIIMNERVEVKSENIKALSDALHAIDSGTHNLNLNFGGWLPIESAPRDGTDIFVSGWDYGEVGGMRHHFKASFYDGRFSRLHDDGELEGLEYLTHWLPLPEIKE
jgi:DNA-binding XRE family transcriptional regulator